MRRIIAAILALGALMGLSAGFCPAALADGDPASDVLLYDSVFAPADLHATSAQIEQLTALVQAMNQAGYPLKVALIASESDLGTVTQLWEKAPDYGVYLGDELSYDFHGALLVMMPENDNLHLQVNTRDIPAGDRRAMAGLNAAGSDLVGSAAYIVDRLARDNGITLPAKLKLQGAARTGGSSATVPLVGFILGLIIVAGAWGASLRLRPVRRKVLA